MKIYQLQSLSEDELGIIFIIINKLSRADLQKDTIVAKYDIQDSLFFKTDYLVNTANGLLEYATEDGRIIINSLIAKLTVA